jgi:hypothetical protein
MHMAPALPARDVRRPRINIVALATSATLRSSALVGADDAPATGWIGFTQQSESIDQPQKQQRQSDAACGKP